ncbi:MAG: ATP phosphoribosyltransferase regulatory subunit [Rhizobiaceae bacterium]|nr:ATP phosphoribosyltransferase regulatory subunit [Rhizobiaceae bacterium]
MLETLLTNLRRVAPDEAEVDILQPADPFLETAGEDLRRRIFITESIDGVVHCLRPEFTIPICLHHVANAGVNRSAKRYAYGGTVFRQARRGTSEFLQAGLEDLGNPDRVEADVACILDLDTSLSNTGVEDVQIALGDQKLFAVVVESLQLPPAIARRLVRSFGAPALVEAQIERLTDKSVKTNGAREAEELALAGDVVGLVEHVAGKMQAANLAAQTGRSPQAIAERMIDKMQESQFQLDAKSADLLRRYLAMEIPMVRAPEALKGFADETGLTFGLAGKEFFRRAAAMEAAGLDLSRITYKASLGRNLEYYTGILIEASIGGVVVAGGGRYDRLCGLLGSRDAIPAVGFSISVDRLGEAK